ncbi:DUF2071 domain-containing protein [bacterium]|nr:DUF2071 domain-containing protein [bacterium]
MTSTLTPQTSAGIDRLSVTRRPDESAIGFHKWANLSFIHWRVDAELLRPLVPPLLEIDTYGGDAWIGLVPFTLTGVRPWWSPAMPWLSAFHETNVRTYVHRDGRDPGVWFFSLDAARLIAVEIARRFWHLPYFHARMSLQREERTVDYASARRDRRCQQRAELQIRTVIEDAETHSAEPGTLEHFLAERYLLYCSQPNGRLYCGRVWHSAYPLQAARLEQCRQSLLSVAGVPVPENPDHVLFSPGVTVDIFPLKSVEV